MGPWRSKEGIIILNIATYFSCFGEIPAPMPPQSFRHPIREAVKLRLYTESLLTFALQCLQHKLTCSFQNLKSHQKTQDMMTSIFAVITGSRKASFIYRITTYFCFAMLATQADVFISKPEESPENARYDDFNLCRMGERKDWGGTSHQKNSSTTTPYFVSLFKI